MNYLFFTILFNCVFVFIHILIKFNRPLFFKFNLLSIITFIFIINFISLTKSESTYWILLLPILNYIAWGNLIYILNTLLNDKLFKWAKNILILNLVLVIVYTYFIYLTPTVYEYTNNNILTLNIIGKYWYLNFIRILIKFNFIFSALFLITHFKIDSNNQNIYKLQIKNWVSLFYIVLFISMIVLAGIFFNNYIYSFILIQCSLVFISIVILTSFIYKPVAFSFIRFNYYKLSTFNKSSNITLTDDNFTVPFLNNFYYLNVEANLDKYCIDNNIIDKDDFSDAILRNYNMTFNNLINKYRVDYFLSLVQSKNYSNYSIDALAQMAGFSSRHHLYKPFKRFHGGTPSDYIYYVMN